MRSRENNQEISNNFETNKTRFKMRQRKETEENGKQETIGKWDRK